MTKTNPNHKKPKRSKGKIGKGWQRRQERSATAMCVSEISRPVLMQKEFVNWRNWPQERVWSYCFGYHRKKLHVKECVVPVRKHRNVRRSFVQRSCCWFMVVSGGRQSCLCLCLCLFFFFFNVKNGLGQSVQKIPRPVKLDPIQPD